MTSSLAPTPPVPPETHVYGGEIELERIRWLEFTALCRGLTLDERTAPGYYEDPAWSVKDLVGHVGAWLAEAKVQLEQIGVGTYVADDEVDIDALNAVFLKSMEGQPWPVVWSQANAARSLMLTSWFALKERSEAADWWVRKCGADHYAEHLPRLHEWSALLWNRRTREES